MRKINLLFTMMLLSIVTTPIFATMPLAAAKNFETNILKLDCSGFTVSGTGTSDMSAAESPNNWVSASGMQWSSTNCYAANITTGVPHIKQSVQFGSSAGTASAVTPALNLSSVAGKSTKVRVILTAGSNKTGSLTVKLDGNTIGTISASTNAPGNTAFAAFYYTFEYDITAAGTSASSLTFEQTSVEALGYLYIKEIAVYREPISLLKLNTQLFSANSSTVLSTAAYPNNWVASLGANPSSTSYCYAQNAINTSYGQGVRMGSSSNANVGSFTTNEIDLASSQNYKTKFYIELLMTTNVATVETKLNMKVDASDAQWTFNPQLDNGNNGPVEINTWIPYEAEITGGTSASKLTFFQTRNATETTSIYFRNLRIYREDPSFTTVHNPSQGNVVKIYPNPCINELYTQAKQVRIFNLIGIKVIETEVNGGVVNVSSLSKGAYLVECIDEDNNTSIFKIAKR